MQHFRYNSGSAAAERDSFTYVLKITFRARTRRCGSCNAVAVQCSSKVTMSQIMERWPWPKSYWIKNADTNHAVSEHHDPSETMTAVKLVLWPSGVASEPSLPEPKPHHVRQTKPKRMWSKLPPLKQIHTKMNWLKLDSGGETNLNTKQVSKQNNAVFRSNSFRFERPPPEDDARMYSRHYRGIHSVKSHSITAQDVSDMYFCYASCIYANSVAHLYNYLMIVLLR